MTARSRAARALVAGWPQLVVTALVAYASWPLLTAEAHVPFDLELYHFPLLASVQEAFASGALPGWDPFSYGGVPLLANAQSAWAYPPHLALDAVLTLTGGELSQRALNVLHVLHVWLAAASTCVLVRRRGLGDAAAAFAGVFVVLCGAVVSQAQHLGMTETFAWLPLSVLVVDLLRERVTPARVAALGGLVALMVTAGFLPLVLSAGLLLLLTAALPARTARRALPATAGGLALGAALAAVVLLPVAALVSVYPPLEPHGPVPLEALVTAVFPNAYGHWAATPAEYTGGSVIGLTNGYFYLGGAALLALPLALASGRRVVPDAVVAGVLLVLTFGGVAEWVASTVQDASRLGTLWRPELHAYVAAVPLALTLAHAFARVPDRRQLAALAGFLVVLALLPFRDAFDRAVDFPPDAPRRELVLLAAGVVLVAVLALARRRVPARWATAALAVLAVAGAVELATTVPDRNFVASPGPGSAADERQTNDGSQVLSVLRNTLAPGERVAADIPRLPAEWAGFSPVWRIPNVNGFQPQLSRHLLERVRAFGSDFSGETRIFPVTPRERPLFKELNARYVVVAAAQDPFAGVPGYREVFADALYRVHRVEGRMARASVLDRACLARLGRASIVRCAREPVPVRLVSRDDRRLRLPRAAATVLTGEPWYPGWQARVGDRELDVRRAGYLAVVDVPAGGGELELSYRPPGFLPGLIVTLLALAGCAVAVLRGRRRRGGQSGGSTPANRRGWRSISTSTISRHDRSVSESIEPAAKR